MNLVGDTLASTTITTTLLNNATVHFYTYVQRAVHETEHNRLASKTHSAVQCNTNSIANSFVMNLNSRL